MQVDKVLNFSDEMDPGFVGWKFRDLKVQQMLVSLEVTTLQKGVTLTYPDITTCPHSE